MLFSLLNIKGMWNSLSSDIFHNVCSYLDNTSLREVDGVCHSWRNTMRDRYTHNLFSELIGLFLFEKGFLLRKKTYFHHYNKQ